MAARGEPSAGPIRRLRPNSDEAFDDAVRLLLERLSPAERATYVLREGFEYPYRQIAETCGSAHPTRGNW